jgi:hypothetical protein
VPWSPDLSAIRSPAEPAALLQALGALHSRAAQVLIFRCLEGRPPQECAALYGVDVPQWEILFLDAARALASDTAPLDDSIRKTLARRLQAELATPVAEPLPATKAVAALSANAQEVQRLLAEAEQRAAASPERAREGWIRRLAVVLIIGVSLFVWLRERNKPPAPTPSHNTLPPRRVG